MIFSSIELIELKAINLKLQCIDASDLINPSILVGFSHECAFYQREAIQSLEGIHRCRWS